MEQYNGWTIKNYCQLGIVCLFLKVVRIVFLDEIYTSYCASATQYECLHVKLILCMYQTRLTLKLMK